LTVDNGSQTAKRDGTTVLRWRSFQEFNLYAPAARQAFVGTPLDERVTFNSDAQVSADMGDGDDVIEINPANTATSILRGGSGTDTIMASGTARYGEDDVRYAQGIDGDLITQTVTFDRGTTSTTFRLGGINGLSALAPTVRLLGDADDNVLDGAGCDVLVLGGEGDDLLLTSRDFEDDGIESCPQNSFVERFEGQAGDDRLIGSWYGETLIGGAGEDFADGAYGTDTCDAETEKNCELD
jgi:Ca2+-binding RTX toxin-like protein